MHDAGDKAYSKTPAPRVDADPALAEQQTPGSGDISDHVPINSRAAEEQSPSPIDRVVAFYDELRAAAAAALRVAEAALTLVRAEFALARSSALRLVWLSFALIFFGVGAWLATSAALAAAVYQLTGNLLVGIGSVAVLNLICVAVILWTMLKHWRDLSFPRTRHVVARLREPDKEADTPNS